jgi:hypothetical protein
VNKYCEGGTVTTTVNVNNPTTYSSDAIIKSCAPGLVSDVGAKADTDCREYEVWFSTRLHLRTQHTLQCVCPGSARFFQHFFCL